MFLTALLGPLASDIILLFWVSVVVVDVIVHLAQKRPAVGAWLGQLPSVSSNRNDRAVHPEIASAGLPEFLRDNEGISL